MPATRAAFAQCRSIRTASVFTPRSTSQLSNGPGTAPMAFWWYASRSPRPGSATTSAPPTTSECPPRYFVVECRTTSAPSASGCCRYGEAKVLSTTSSAPCPWASPASAVMSAIPSSGLVGVSHQTIRVGDRDRGVLQPPPGQHPGEQPERPAVRVVRDQHVVTRAERGAQQAVARGQAGGEAEPGRAAFQGGQAGLQRGARRVRRAAVLIPAAQPADPVLLVRRGGIDRHRHRARHRVRLLAGVDGEGLEAVPRRTHSKQTIRADYPALAGSPSTGRCGAYSSSMRSAYTACTPRRFSFIVAVSCSESGSHSSPSSANRLIDSTWANRLLTSVTPRSSSARTAGSAASAGRSVAASPWACAHTGATSGSRTSSATRYGRASPTTQAWPTSGSDFSSASMFAGETFLPPEVMISSFFRSTIDR